VNKETIKYVLHQSTERQVPATHPRQVDVPLETGKVVTLTGVRRSGKTFLLFHTIRRLVASGVDRRRILYLNLSDDRLYPATLADLDLILPAHGELYPETIRGRRYVFLDEVQEVEGWERYVRRIHDTEDVGVFVTGSSSRLLTRDLAPALRGRSIGFEVFPLSFSETTEFLGLSRRRYDREDQARLTHALEIYVRWGGLPEIVLADETLRPLILAEYASLLFHRDLVQRFSIRNERVMKLLLKYCASRPASLLSAHKLHCDLRSQGVKVSKNTIYEYLGHLEEAYVLFLVPRHERSVRRQEQNPKKVHLIDPVLTSAFTAAADGDRGARLENLVFLEERRRTRDVWYASNSHEVDVVAESAGKLRFLNVTWSLADSETRDRETRAMAWGRARYPGAEGLLVAHETAGAAGARTAVDYFLGR
jgi:predicted AAA+ superfamily ATPase